MKENIRSQSKVIAQACIDDTTKESADERRLRYIGIAETFKQEVLEATGNKNALFSCEGQDYVQFRHEEILYDPDTGEELQKSFSPSVLMNLSYKSNNHTEFEVYMTDYITKHYGLPPSRNDIQTIVIHLKKYTLENPQQMYNRCAFINNSIYYNIGDHANTLICINKDGWDTIRGNEDVIFRKENHQLPQAYPFPHGNFKKILKYLNITNEDDQILILVYIITCYLPDIEHVILQIHGDSGSGKSTVPKIINLLIDPTNNENGTDMKDKKVKDVKHQVSHRYYCNFDNVGNINKEMSDFLCQCVTGYSGQDKKLYTDNDEVNYNFKSCISLNGIHPETTETDLINRLIDIEINVRDNPTAPRILLKQFNEEKGDIISGVFDILKESIRLYDKGTYVIPGSIRMVEFAEWGYAIAEALGYGGERFIKIYMDNMAKKDMEAIEDNVVGNIIYQYMNQAKFKTISLPPTQISDHLKIFKDNLKTMDDLTWPTTPSHFSRALGTIKGNLRKVGIECTITNSNGNKGLIIKNNNFVGEEVPFTPTNKIITPRIKGIIMNNDLRKDL